MFLWVILFIELKTNNKTILNVAGLCFTNGFEFNLDSVVGHSNVSCVIILKCVFKLGLMFQSPSRLM